MKTMRAVLMMMTFVAMAFPVAAQDSNSGEATTTSTAAEATTTITATAAAVPAAASASDGASADEVRGHLNEKLRQSPPELGRILSIDPSLLANDAFLSGYPQLAAFVASHPDVRRHPRFYVAASDDAPPPRRGIVSELMEMLGAGFAMMTVVLTGAWLIRTIIEQRRWSRLSRTQAEVHNKVLERFGTSAELLEYMRTPAGSKFLESAPIPLHADRAPQNPPLARVLWSIHLGVIVIAVGIGLVLVSLRFSGDNAGGLFALGVIAFCIGGGFIASAVVSLVVARRLGVWQVPAAGERAAGLGIANAGNVE